MIDSIQIADSIKTAIDTAMASSNGPNNFNQLTFNLDNISKGDGILITVVGYVVVFLSLLFLYVAFNQISKFLMGRTRKKLKASGESENNNIGVSGEVNAAISMALHLYFEEAHDFENTVLTIKKVKKPYSPWSSKIYGLRQFPRK
ncbi:MAG: OadG family protein [Ignavibacteriaceae bacterium]|nr:OadG family protein [Ignavibacteriaceae bacterium]